MMIIIIQGNATWVLHLKTATNAKVTDRARISEPA